MFRGGARHGPNEFAGSGEARVLLALGASVSAGECGRFVPALVDAVPSDASTGLSH